MRSGRSKPHFQRFLAITRACLFPAALCAAIFCAIPVAAYATSLEVASLAKPPVIDGDIGDAEWTGAGTADQNFVQIEPAFGQASPFRTVIRVAQTATALYVAIESFDPEIARLAAAVTQRDGDLVVDDSVAVLLDPFGDGRTAYSFRVNALATQQDSRIADNGRTVDLQWDGAWRSSAMRQDDRWTVEFEIPFSILLYQSGGKRTWKANFVRSVPRRLETAVWSGPSESVFRVSGFGDLAGIATPAQGTDAWQIIPYTIGSFASGNGPRFEFGGDVRWRPSSNLGADLTVNPDFALAEADVEDINLTRFEVFVPEKRPFFLEGTEMFNQRMRQFNSRRIGDITWGGKTNGKIGDTDFSFIAASEDRRLSGAAGGDTAYYGVLRTQYSLARGSNIGLLATNRRLGNQDAGTIGVDTTAYFTDTISFTGQFFRVHGPTGNGGLAWLVRPSYDTATTHFHVRYGDIATGIRNDVNAVGFLQDDNRKEIDTNLSHIFWLDDSPVERVRPVVNYNRYYSQAGVLRGWALAPRVEALFRNGMKIELERRDEFRLFEKKFQNYQNTFTAGWDSRNGRSVSAYVGNGFNFDNDLMIYGGTAAWAVGERWRLNYTLTRLELSPDIKRESTTIHVFGSTYAFSPDLFVKLFLQSNSAIDKNNAQLLGLWRFSPPFGSFQIAYQRGTSAFGQQSSQGDTLFTKFAWVL